MPISGNQLLARMMFVEERKLEYLDVIKTNLSPRCSIHHAGMSGMGMFPVCHPGEREGVRAGLPSDWLKLCHEVSHDGRWCNLHIYSKVTPPGITLNTEKNIFFIKPF